RELSTRKRLYQTSSGPKSLWPVRCKTPKVHRREGLRDRKTSGPRFVGHQAVPKRPPPLNPHTGPQLFEHQPAQPIAPPTPPTLPNFLETVLISEVLQLCKPRGRLAQCSWPWVGICAFHFRIATWRSCWPSGVCTPITS